MERILIKIEKSYELAEGPSVRVTDSGGEFDVTYHDTPRAAAEDVENRLLHYGHQNCDVEGDAMSEALVALLSPNDG